MVREWLYLVVGVVLGAIAVIYWALAMFSDSGVARFIRELDKDDSLWMAPNAKNATSLVMPAFGTAFLAAAPLIALDQNNPSHEAVGNLLSLIAGFFLLVGIVGFFPVRLPRWMYPQWREARRAQKRHHRIATASGLDPRTTARLDPHATTTGPLTTSTATTASPDPQAIPWPPPEWHKTKKHRPTTLTGRITHALTTTAGNIVFAAAMLASFIPATIIATTLGQWTLYITTPLTLIIFIAATVTLQDHRDKRRRQKRRKRRPPASQAQPPHQP